MRSKTASTPLNLELDDRPTDLRWREWMLRVEAVLFAAPTPVSRETLAKVVGSRCNLEFLIEDIRAELVSRPYEVVSVAGGWAFRTRPAQADAIAAALGVQVEFPHISERESLVLVSIAYHQPITRQGLAEITGVEVSRDLIGRLRRLDLITAGPRSPVPGAPYTLVTTNQFLIHFGLNGLSDLPGIEALRDSGLVAMGEDATATAIPVAGADIMDESSDF